jgi:LacI family transcriptional regulator
MLEMSTHFRYNKNKSFEGWNCSGMPTINDIAKLAQVSKTTVSLALSDDPRISDATKSKIRTIAESIGYIPNRLARGLSRAKSQAIGVLFYDDRFDTLEEFFHDTVRGIGHEAFERGYNVVLLGLSRNSQHEGDTPDWTDTVLRSGVDGIIVISMSTKLVGFEKLVSMKFPMVIIGKREVEGASSMAGLNYFATDQFGSGRTAAAYLRGLGHTEAAVVVPKESQPWMEERSYGFFTGDPRWLAEMQERTVVLESAHPLGEQNALQLARRYTAFFAVSPMVGLQLLNELLAAGVKVPEKVSILVFDDFPSAAYQNPPITVIRQDLRAMGQLAFRRIMELTEEEGSGPQQVLLAGQLIERKSCGIAPHAQ